mmetsp:Transcript_64816/g.181227  ORF Transcript_64816/g.181227 Transcript_64816/m.181227 type:complete len:207 (-) Transcript_64816:41-661(-)
MGVAEEGALAPRLRLCRVQELRDVGGLRLAAALGERGADAPLAEALARAGLLADDGLAAFRPPAQVDALLGRQVGHTHVGALADGARQRHRLHRFRQVAIEVACERLRGRGHLRRLRRRRCGTRCLCSRRRGGRIGLRHVLRHPLRRDLRHDLWRIRRHSRHIVGLRNGAGRRFRQLAGRRRRHDHLDVGQLHRRRSRQRRHRDDD